MDQDRTSKQIWTSPTLEALEMRYTAQTDSSSSKGGMNTESNATPFGTES